MKKYTIFLAFITIIISSCYKENHPSIVNEEDVNIINDTLKSLNLIKEFYYKVNHSKTRSTVNIEINEVKKVKLKCKTSKNNTDTIDIYNFTFYNEGKQGFSIVSPDERINKVLAYCEDGSIEDTTYIKGMSIMLEGIPLVIKDILKDINKDTLYSTKVSTKSGDIGEVVLGFQSEWGQGDPYNRTLIEKNCSGVMTRPLAGCGAIATSRALLYADKAKNYFSQIGLYLNQLRVIDARSESLHIQNSIGQYVSTVGTRIKTIYGCDQSSSNMENVVSFLKQIGLIQGVDFDVYASNNVDINLLIKSISNRKPVIARGSDSNNNGHAWLMDGYSTLTDITHGTPVYYIRCNWGWYGRCNGWYSVPRSGDPYDPDSGKEIASYYRNNKYIYFY